MRQVLQFLIFFFNFFEKNIDLCTAIHKSSRHIVLSLEIEIFSK